MGVEEAACFLLEGFDLAPSHVARLQAALERTEVRGCFLGHGGFSVEGLAGYRGPKPQHRGASRVELGEAAAWIRRRSGQLREECGAAGVPCVDVGELGFEPPWSRPGACCLGAAEPPGRAPAKSTPSLEPAARAAAGNARAVQLTVGYVQSFRQAAQSWDPAWAGGPPIIFSMAGPPVRRNRTTSTAATARKTRLRKVV